MGAMGHRANAPPNRSAAAPFFTVILSGIFSVYIGRTF
jgi:hypothetical protein